MEHHMSVVSKSSIYIITLIVFMSCGTLLCAQNDSLPDSKGRDFWFCFPPNFHNGGLDIETVQRRDSLFIYVAAEVPANVTLSYSDSSGRKKVRSFRLSDPTKVLTIGEQFYPYELIGYNRCTTELDKDGGQCLRVARQSFHLVSDVDVTVYALDQAQTTSDAFLVLPKDALGNQYLVMSYYADPQNGGSSATPSQCAIVATEDSTTLHFDAKADLYQKQVPPDSIYLNKGDVYLIQSDIGSDLSPMDLTGSLVRANKPVAVFGGQQRAILPIQDRDNLTSRDCLIEQMTPISTWGHGAIVVPYPEPTSAVVRQGDRFRVLAAYDSTAVFIDSAYVLTLNAGQFYEADSRAAHIINCSRAVCVAQFKHTSAREAGNNQLGDPFMMLIPPSNQFLKSYRFINAQAGLPDSGFRSVTYVEQWLSVVLPTTSIPSLLIDGQAVNVQFNKVPKSSYSFASIRMTDGVHTVAADTGVGIYVYGYGIANSYGYVGGMAYKRYDFNAPQVFDQSDCYKVAGVAFDTALADSRIESVSILADSVHNVAVTVQAFNVPSDSVVIKAHLVDSLSDGSFVAEVRDVEGYKTRHRFVIPGYGLRILDAQSNDQVSIDTAEKRSRSRSYCHDYMLVNRSASAQTIRTFVNTSVVGKYTVDPPVPLHLNGRDSLHITVCYRYDVDGIYNDTLFAVTDCRVQSMLTRTIQIGHDTTAPRLTHHDEPCASPKTIELSDVGDFASGIASITITDTVNCRPILLFGSDRSVINLGINDWRLDAVVGLNVVDSAGNSRSMRDTVEGFTVFFSSVDSVSKQRAIEDQPLHVTACDSVSLTNYGWFPKTFDQIPVLDNRRFSIPQHQLPFSLQPGETKFLKICYEPDGNPPAIDSLWRDTVQLEYQCHQRDLYLRAGLAPWLLNGVTSCNIPVVIHSGDTSTLMAVLAPNPASDQARVFFNSNEVSDLRLSAIDDYGKETIVFEGKSIRGMQQLVFSTSTLPSGVYNFVLRCGNLQVNQSLIVIH